MTFTSRAGSPGPSIRDRYANYAGYCDRVILRRQNYISRITAGGEEENKKREKKKGEDKNSTNSRSGWNSGHQAYGASLVTDIFGAINVDNKTRPIC
jgi:hypothetical protein